MQSHSTIPLGFCQCGCGARTSIALKTSRRRRTIKGQPHRFIWRHNHVPIPIEDRFWEKVHRSDAPNSCWEWTAKARSKSMSNGGGYGIFGITHSKRIGAHRMAWILTYGAVPDGLYVCHHCDNPLCCRPDHLFLGTQRENMADMLTKDRYPTGSRHYTHTHPELRRCGSANSKAKFTEAEVRAIRARYAEGKISQRELAKEIGLAPSNLSRILLGYSYRNA